MKYYRLIVLHQDNIKVSYKFKNIKDYLNYQKHFLEEHVKYVKIKIVN